MFKKSAATFDKMLGGSRSVIGKSGSAPTTTAAAESPAPSMAEKKESVPLQRMNLYSNSKAPPKKTSSFLDLEAGVGEESRDSADEEIDSDEEESESDDSIVASSPSNSDDEEEDRTNPFVHSSRRPQKRRHEIVAYVEPEDDSDDEDAEQRRLRRQKAKSKEDAEGPEGLKKMERYRRQEKDVFKGVDIEYGKKGFMEPPSKYGQFVMVREKDGNIVRREVEDLSDSDDDDYEGDGDDEGDEKDAEDDEVKSESTGSPKNDDDDDDEKTAVTETQKDAIKVWERDLSKKKTIQTRSTDRGKRTAEFVPVLIPPARMEEIVKMDEVSDSIENPVLDEDADTTDGHGDADEDDANQRDISKFSENVRAIFIDRFQKANIRDPYGNPVPLPDICRSIEKHAEAMIALAHIQFNAATEQQTSKNLQLEINQGTPLRIGNSPSGTQGEIVQGIRSLFAEAAQIPYLLEILREERKH